jgi:hypothetical protein
MLEVPIDAKLAEAIRANPTSIKIVAKGADGTSVIGTPWRSMSVSLGTLNPWVRYDGVLTYAQFVRYHRALAVGLELADITDVLVQKVRDQSLKCFATDEQIYLVVPDEALRRFVAEFPDAVEVGADFIDDPLGYHSTSGVKVDAITLTHVCDIYGRDPNVWDWIKRLVLFGKIKYFSQEHKHYFVKSSAAKAFRAKKPEAEEPGIDVVLDACARSRRTSGGEPTKDELLAASASRALRNVRDRRR